MKEPMLWNTLEQASIWLSDQTNSNWNPQKILSFSIDHYRDENKIKKNNLLYTVKDGKRRLKNIYFDKNELGITHLPPSPTYLGVLFPGDVRIGVYRYKKDIEKILPNYKLIAGDLVRIWEFDIRIAPLYQSHLVRLFFYNEANIRLPYIKFFEYKYIQPCKFDLEMGPCKPLCHGGWEYGLFEPIKELTEEETKKLDRYSNSCHGYIWHDDIAEIGGVYRVTSGMLGISKGNLERLLCDYLVLLKQVPNKKELRPAQQDKLKCQMEAVNLWRENKAMTIEEIISHQNLAPFSKKYTGKHTLRSWASEVDPRDGEKRGRPKKSN